MNGAADHKPLMAATVCHFIWGLSFLTSRIALDHAPVLILLSHRFLLAFAAMSLLLPTRLGDCRCAGNPSGPCCCWA